MSQIDDLPPLRTVIERHELAAKKNLGQNFLLDLNITMKIARQTGPLDGETIVEIGPGPGGLTRALLANNARKVIAVERDERCIPVLEEIQSASGGRLQFYIGDALEINIDELVDQSSPGQPYKIIANLPYNVATPLFTNWLSGDRWPPRWIAMVLMFQKEVAERITATHQDKAWGRLGVLSSWRTQSKIAFDLSPQVFSPPPKVTSSVVVTYPNSVPLQATRRALETVSRAAFGQRRKMLRQSLKALGGEAILNKADVVPTLRAEDLSLDEFVALARVLDDRS